MPVKSFSEGRPIFLYRAWALFAPSVLHGVGWGGVVEEQVVKFLHQSSIGQTCIP